MDVKWTALTAAGQSGQMRGGLSSSLAVSFGMRTAVLSMSVNWEHNWGLGESWAKERERWEMKERKYETFHQDNKRYYIVLWHIKAEQEDRQGVQKNCCFLPWKEDVSLRSRRRCWRRWADRYADRQVVTQTGSYTSQQMQAKKQTEFQIRRSQTDEGNEFFVCVCRWHAAE